MRIGSILQTLTAVLSLGVPLVAQTPAAAPTRLTFDVASIHPSKPGLQTGGIKPIPGGHGYTAINIPVKVMISLMYKVPIRQVEGGPDWLNSEPFDVEARVDGTFHATQLQAKCASKYAPAQPGATPIANSAAPKT